MCRNWCWQNEATSVPEAQQLLQPNIDYTCRQGTMTLKGITLRNPGTLTPVTSTCTESHAPGDMANFLAAASLLLGGVDHFDDNFYPLASASRVITCRRRPIGQVLHASVTAAYCDSTSRIKRPSASMQQFDRNSWRSHSTSSSCKPQMCASGLIQSGIFQLVGSELLGMRTATTPSMCSSAAYFLSTSPTMAIQKPGEAPYPSCNCAPGRADVGAPGIGARWWALMPAAKASDHALSCPLWSVNPGLGRKPPAPPGPSARA